MQTGLCPKTQARWCAAGLLPALLLLAAVSGCAGRQPGGGALAIKDPHSFSNPAEVAVTHLTLLLDVDFSSRTIRAEASWKIRNLSGARELRLDTRGLTIRRVQLLESGSISEASFELGQERPLLGQPLVVRIRPGTEEVLIAYETTGEADALQWLEPRQTAGRKQPFLFTQSQAILARTWIPCQDTPAVRFTYWAAVEVPGPITAVMSAAAGKAAEDLAGGRKRFFFEMPQAVPSYLMALAAGELSFKALGERSGVYAEPSVLESAAWEFADTEKMMLACEELFGPYRWGRYDILVLPPSFPFGGMENPRLTFATPTILAGDRSLVALVAHELAHSWSGNLVTNATWDDFWLNEGFTVYLEHRIMERLYGREYDEMLARLGLDELSGTVKELLLERPADTHLKLDLAGRDPDEGMTDVAYEKGYLFLRMLEDAFGRERWDVFLRSYFDRFAFQPMTTEGFLAFLDRELLAKDRALAAGLRIREWVYGPGLPGNLPVVRSAALEKAATAAGYFAAGVKAAALKTEGWTTHEWLHFLRHLPSPLPAERLADLDEVFSLTTSKNSEILCQWFLVALPGGYRPVMEPLESFLEGVGRRKFLSPLYRELAKTPGGLRRARKIYARARPGYHPVAIGTLDGILGWTD
ncbi:MAG: M1 family metallopeptidase [Planctomycetota bacterium]|nr:M1 family metallopeptidase [Planctomycetota bacterium]